MDMALPKLFVRELEYVRSKTKTWTERQQWHIIVALLIYAVAQGNRMANADDISGHCQLLSLQKWSTCSPGEDRFHNLFISLNDNDNR